MNQPPGPGDTSPRFRADDPGAYRFGRFELHPARRQLLRDGEPVDLQPKVLEFIAYLLEHRGRAVDKNELLDAIWPRQVVTEAALSRCVMKARRALDDEADCPQVILTVHGHGFRFIATAEPLLERRSTPRGSDEAAPAAIGDEAADANAATGPSRLPDTPARPENPGEPGGAVMPAESPAALQRPDGGEQDAPPGGDATEQSRSAQRRLGSVLALVALVMALAGGWYWQRWQEQRVAADGPVRVAVLPVDNGTGEARYDWTRLGLMSAMADVLRNDVTVVEASDLLDLDDAMVDLDAAAKLERLSQAHGATHLVESRLVRSGGKLRLDYELRNRSGDRRRRTVVGADVPGLAHAAGADLRASVGSSKGEGAVPEDSFANETYLRGMAFRLQGEVETASEYFRMASEQAPQAFWPRLQLAVAAQELGNGEQARTMLEALVQEADADGDLDQQLAARNALSVSYWRAGDNARARPLLEQALALAEASGRPDRSVPVLSRLGILATYSDEYESARDYLARAIEASLRAGMPGPSGELSHSLAQLALREGDLASAGVHFEAALAKLRQVGNRRVEAIVLNGLGTLRRREGKFEQARDLARSTVELHRATGNRGGESSALIGLAVAEAQLGRVLVAADIARQALALAEQIKESPNAAGAASLLGQLTMDLGRLQESRIYLEKAQALMTAADDRVGAQRQRLYLARLTLAEGDLRGAERQAEALLAEVGQAGSPTMRLDVLRILAQLRLKSGDAAGARQLLDEALAISGKLDDARRTAQIRVRLAEAWLEDGKVEAAAAEMDLAAEPLAGDVLWLRVNAALLAARGDAAGALAQELAAKAAAGERWQAEDEARLAQRQAAAP